MNQVETENGGSARHLVREDKQPAVPANSEPLPSFVKKRARRFSDTSASSFLGRAFSALATASGSTSRQDLS